ncbi:hypothetical protein Hte_007641 [Hypoxylon texense]
MGKRFWNRGEQFAATPNSRGNQSTAGDTDDENEDNAGLKILYSPTGSNLQTEVDIVCIHGLGGHREDTWTAKQPETGRTVFWIKDFLPAELPHARIMTYGYSSRVFSVKYLTQRTLYSHSKTLLTTLKHSRQDIDATNRPLIFISHGLGGLVLKSALIHAENDYDFNDICASTAGVVFIGTPHQGTPHRSWTEIVGDMIRTEIDLDRMRNTLESDLNWLEFQLEQYKSLDGVFPTYCLYEEETSTTDSQASAYLTHSETVQQLRAMYEGSKKLVSRNKLLNQLCRDPPAVVYDDEGTFRIPISLPKGRVEPFVGRDAELTTLHITRRTERLVTLFGPPGIGKTQIALEYAHKYQNHYSSVFWVDAQSRFTLHSSFLKLAEQLKNHYVRTTKSEEQLKALHRLYLSGLIDEEGWIQSYQGSPGLLSLVFKKWLERPGNDGWLLIIDGADRETDLREFHIDELLDSPINGRIIITSRALQCGHTLEVPELNPDDAMALLYSQAARLKQFSDKDVLELVHKLGRVPLAIKQAGAFLSSSQWSVREYSSSLSSNPLPKSSHSPLPNAWSISIGQLDKLSVELLDTIAFLSDDDCSIEVIKSGVRESSHSTRYALVDDGLTTLKKYSLIRYDSETQTVALGFSMSEWLRESKKITSNDYRLQARLACSSVSSYLKSVTMNANSIAYTAKKYRLEEQLLPYVERCVNYIQVLSRDEADWGTLGDICRRQGQHNLAKQYYEIACSDHQQIPLRAEILLQDMHDLESCLGPTHIRTIGCAVLLASRYQEEGQHAKAEIIWRRANSSQSKTLGIFHPLTLSTAERLAITLQQLGKYSQAKATYSSICNAMARVFGDDHPDCLRLMANIAVLYTLERRFDEAEKEYRKVLGNMEKKLGRNHDDVKKIQKYIALNNEQKRPGVEGVAEGFRTEGFRNAPLSMTR